ncbi:MAG: hypothetical protein R3212_05985, partial [Xanthomonadales bacterium]|nr:hypothetical protein [Xanthomonadales bacterium]
MALILICWPGQPLAQSSAGETDEIEEIIVTATRLPTPERQLPFAYASVDRQEIQRARQQLGLDEALA